MHHGCKRLRGMLEHRDIGDSVALAALDQNEVLKGVLVLLTAGAPFDTATATLDGWTGWIVPLLLSGLLVAMKRLPVRNPPDLRGAEAQPPAPAHALASAAR